MEKKNGINITAARGEGRHKHPGKWDVTLQETGRMVFSQLSIERGLEKLRQFLVFVTIETVQNFKKDVPKELHSCIKRD